MIAATKSQLQNILYRLGCYKCSHFYFKKIIDKKSKKRSCCGGTKKGDQYIPSCILTGGACAGLPQCPRLDVKTKSKLIQEWKKDLGSNNSIDPTQYIK